MDAVRLHEPVMTDTSHLPWDRPLREWAKAQRDALDDLNRRGLRLLEARALILDEIANDPDPGRVDIGRA